MKILTTIFLICGGVFTALAEDSSPADAGTNAVVISTALINRLVAEARTNNPSLKAADSRVRPAKRTKLQHSLCDAEGERPHRELHSPERPTAKRDDEILIEFRETPSSDLVDVGIVKFDLDMS